MADVETIGFSQVTISLGDGADPEVFTKSCMLNMERSLEFTTNSEEDQLPDCDDDEKPVQVVRQPLSKDMQVSGMGKVSAGTDPGAYADWIDWWDTGEKKNVEVKTGDDSNGGKVFTFPAILQTFSVTAQRARYVEANITIVPAGKVTVEDASA